MKKSRIGKMKKAQIQFGWIFAVIVGALILFLAFYFVGAILFQQREKEETEYARFLDILMNPFASFGHLIKSAYDKLMLPKESEVIIECNKEGFENLGYNEISVIQKAEKSNGGIQKKVYDKYIFAPQPMKGKEFDALSKPFEMPWRITNIIILWPSNQEYCFVNAPSKVKNELGNESNIGLNISSIIFSNSINKCPKNSIKVCFGGNCNGDIKVDTGEKTVENCLGNSCKTVYYSDFGGYSLMYAAIFSDPILYECNIKRIASRIKLEVYVYQKKALALRQRGCNSVYDLNPLKNAAENLFKNPSNPRQITDLEQAARTLKNINEAVYTDCVLF